MSGLIADSRTLIDRARVEAQVSVGGGFRLRVSGNEFLCTRDAIRVLVYAL